MKKLAAVILVLWSTLVCTAFAPLYVPAINVVSTNDPCASLDSSTTALVARMTVDPGCPRKVVINNLIVSLKTAGVWTKLDVLYLFAAHDSQAALLNWVSTSYDATNNSSSFTVDRGFTGNDGNQYIDTNFNISSASGRKYLQNDAHLSAWSRNNGTQTNGIIGGSTSNQRIVPNSDLGKQYYTINAASGSTVFTGLSGDGGQILANRPSSSSISLYLYGTLKDTASRTSTAPSNTNIWFNRSNRGYSSYQVSSGSIGGSLTSTEISDFNTALQTYMTAVGAYP